MQKQIADLEAQLAKLRMSKIPLCSEEQLKAVSDRAIQAGMERDLIAALQAYGTTQLAGPEDAAKAGEVLCAAVWTTLYLTLTTRAPPQATQTVPAPPTTPPHAVPIFQAAPKCHSNKCHARTLAHRGHGSGVECSGTGLETVPQRPPFNRS